jgi:hypothetical protein
MRDDPDVLPPQDGHVASRAPAALVLFVLGVALMPVGIAAMVGGAILHFAVKAGKVDLFPYAGRFVILLGFVAAIMGVAIAGSRAAVWFGVGTLVAGAGMFVFGYANLAEPSLRFYAPLGFFIALAGGAVIWAGRAWDEEMRKERARKERSNG